MVMSYLKYLDFSQYAVAYNEGAAAGSEDDGTSAESGGTDDGTTEDHAESHDKKETVTAVDQDTGALTKLHETKPKCYRIRV